MQTKLTVGMIRYLDQGNGKDLINTIFYFRIAFGLTDHEASYLYNKWQRIPVIG